MTDYKLVPIDPTPEMVEAAEDAYMPFGDMEMAIRMALLAAPAVQGEPVGEVRFELGAPSVVYGELYNEAAPHLVPGTLLYATQQPAAQQPDVTRLLEALTELCDEIDKHEIHSAVSETSILWFKRKARTALAAHRKQQEGEA